MELLNFYSDKYLVKNQKSHFFHTSNPQSFKTNKQTQRKHCCFKILQTS